MAFPLMVVIAIPCDAQKLPKELALGAFEQDHRSYFMLLSSRWCDAQALPHELTYGGGQRHHFGCASLQSCFGCIQEGLMGTVIVIFLIQGGMAKLHRWCLSGIGTSKSQPWTASEIPRLATLAHAVEERDLVRFR